MMKSTFISRNKQTYYQIRGFANSCIVPFTLLEPPQGSLLIHSGIVVNTWRSTHNEAGAHTRRTASGSEMPHSRPRIAVVLQILSRLGHSGKYKLRSADVAGLQSVLPHRAMIERRV